MSTIAEFRKKAHDANTRTFGRSQAFYHDVRIVESFLEPVLIDGRQARSAKEAAHAARRVAAFATKLANNLEGCLRRQQRKLLNQSRRPGQDG